MLAFMFILFCQLQTSHNCQRECENLPPTLEETSGGGHGLLVDAQVSPVGWHQPHDCLGPWPLLTSFFSLMISSPPATFSCILVPTAGTEIALGATPPAPESVRTVPSQNIVRRNSGRVCGTHNCLFRCFSGCFSVGR